MVIRENISLTSNQKRLWIFAQQDKSNPAYNLQLTYHFRGEVDANVLNKSLTLLFERQHTMFSVFKQKDGNPYIEIIPGTVNVKFVDFSNLPIDTRKEKLLAFAGEDSRKCFDLESGPLYRLYLLKEHDESYYFHATIHHIIFDGWSRRVFVQELSKIYVSLIQEVKDDPEPLNFHSYDYAGIEEASFSAGEEAELISFWKDNLQDSPSELRLPFDHPRGAESTGLGRRESFEISEKSTFKLKEISKKEDTTLFNTVLSILGVLLQKYSGEDDICIGVPVSCRRFHPELDKIFGLFINTTVVRLKIDNNNKINDHLKKSKVAVRNAIKNSKLPFENIVEAVNPERIAGVNPLFQVSLSWMTDMTIPMDFGNIEGERVTLPEGVSPFDVTLYMREDGDVIKGDIEYSTDIFQRNTILRLKDSFIHLVDSIADCPEKNLSEISLISETEQQRITAFNQTESPVPSCLIQDFFEKQSVLQPAKTAVISGNSSLTYKQMNEQANQLAGHLISLGVKSGDVAGICLERSAEMIVSVLGVLKAGCCYLPMDPSFPDDRIRYMYEDSGAKVLISQSSLKEKYSHFPGTDIVLIDSDWEKISRQSTDKSALHTDNQSLAYIIYTSGSTGKPKGVRVHHQSVVNLIESMSVKPGIKPDDILLAVVTLSFDMSVFELFVTLSKGATVVVATSQEVTDGSALINLIDKHNVSIIQATPSLWNILLSSGWKGKNNLKALCGGEALTYSLINQIIPKVGEFWNCYGPTETTVYSACTRITDANAPILIGKPINNTRIYILDKNNNQLPIGVTGEVCIGGLGVTKGYHNRPELTAEKFITFDNDQIIYKTGDLGRFLDDGNIELFGRADNQIKLRGFRIEPGEVEALLSMLKGVREAVVKIHRFEDNDDRLVAFINADGDFKMTKEEIIISLSKHLPAYMIPSFIQVSDGFPRLPNGKINKKALIYELQKADQKQELDFDSLTATQKKLIYIWEDILKINNINPLKSFFDIGGNSLLVIRLLNKIKEELRFTMTFKSFISNPTIIQSADYIDSQSQTTEKAIELVHLTETTHLPLTRNQKRLWIISKLQPDVQLYIIRSTYKFKGSLNREIFEKSLKKLFQHHHILFSVIKEVDGEPYCDIFPTDVVIPFVDYTGQAEEEKQGKVKDFINEVSKDQYDIEKGPLYSMYLIQNAVDEFYFHMSIHHIIFDGWSQGVFVKDLSTIYNSLIKGEDKCLEPLEFQQYDYANYESGRKDNEDSIAFWKENLAGCSPLLNFPYDFPRRDKSMVKGGLEKISFPRAMSDDLRRLSKEEGTSLFTTMLSCFGILMKKYSGEDDLNIGVPVAYRPHTSLEKIFGMFVNTIVVRLKYENEGTFKELIKQADDAAMNAISYQDLPFESVVEIVNPERIDGVNPLFQVAFAWQNNLNQPFTLEGVSSKVLTGEVRAVAFDIALSLWENGDIIEGDIEYNPDILKPETILRLKDNFMNLINNLLADINVPVNAVPIISEVEKKKILEINNTATNYPKDKTIIQLFEDEVNIYPDKKAIVFKESFLTYKHLNEKANQLARVLRNSGVGANTPVGILIDKSVDMIVGIFGILKAGGAYVPLDPEYPEQRKTFILKDSGCRILLTQNKYLSESFEGIVKFSLDSYSPDHIDTSNVEGINSSSDLAYIIYTSGTTGIPKGTLIPHRGVVRLVRNTNYIDFRSEDRILQTSAIVFDASTEEIFGSLLNGATLYIVDKDTLLDPYSLGEVLAKNDITIVDLASALFTQIAESNADIFHKVKYLLIGGDVVSAPHVNKVRKNNPQLAVINGYGPTENSCNSTFYKIDRNFDFNIPIGKPISNSTAYIFDKNMNYQPVGIIGELYVGGDGLSKGYLNRDDLNRVRFIDNPHNPGERLYKTGDLARWLPDWNIEFRGRADNQIKIRGYRVEIGEIEAVLTDIDRVIEAVVKHEKTGEGDYRLIAFLNVPKVSAIDTKDILTKIKAILPAYMIPSAFKLMYGFPTNVNGKIDRKALTYDIDELEKGEPIDINTLNPTEARIYKIWRDTLKTNEIMVSDRFFDAGGNSLLSISVINKIREEFGIKLTFKELVANSTIAKLAELIDSQERVSEASIDLVHITETSHLPLTRNQKRLWLISKLQPDLPLYIIRLTYKLSGSLDQHLFKKSLDLLFQRHHVLFSVINEHDGEPYCDIVPSEVSVSYIDCSMLPKNEKSEKVREVLDTDSKIVFNLKNGPLYRLYFIMTASNEYYFHASIHHIVFDGWSQGVFAGDLSKIYNSLIIGKEIDLEKIEFQQYDYANWEKSIDILKDKNESIEFWKDNLNGCSQVLNFPYDFSRKDFPSGKGSYETISLSKSLSKKIRMICKEEDSSLFSTMLSLFGMLMHRYSGDDDINIGLPIAYRPHSKLENILGMFVNTVVVRLRYEKDLTLRKIIHLTKDAALNAIAHQDLPFETVVEIINPERSSVENPLFHVAFAWQNNFEGDLSINGLKSKRITLKDGASVFDITLYLWENGENIEGIFEYSTDLLKQETILRLKKNFIRLIDNVTEKPDNPAESIPFISDIERKIINDVNRTTTDYPNDKTIVQLFEEIAIQNPEKQALVFKDKYLTYGQLNEKTNQLALILRESGAVNGTPVAILCGKSLGMVVGLLGILKAGSCYVPIDPEYPLQRKKYIINDSNSKILLTQKDYMSIDIDGVKVINLDSDKSFFPQSSNPETIGEPSDLAYIMYTSGTTGNPKGSMILQKSIIRLVRNTNYIEIKSDDRILLTGAMVFDASTFEIWGALLNGGTLFIVEKETILNAKTLGEELCKNNISILWLTSPLFKQIAEVRADIFAKLKYLLVGGDVLSPHHINKVRNENPNLKVINGYGPTENTTFSTTFLIDKEFSSNIPIGKPISNSTAYIFDKGMNYQPIGLIGELYVGGDGLTKGYLNSEVLNKNCFINNPHNPEERLYKTGDRAKWLLDGNIEFHGRIDNQLKIRGFRIELGEIESAISEVLGVVEVVVKPVKIEGDLRLAAFLNLSDANIIDTKEIVNQLKEKLPSYMVPTLFKVLKKLPKNVNGKIDRSKLVYDLEEASKRPFHEMTGMSSTEKVILDIWKEALKSDEISLTDNFFDLGGNSLLAINVFSKIELAFNTDIGLRVFFDSPRIKSLADYIDMTLHKSMDIKSQAEKDTTKSRIINGEI